MAAGNLADMARPSSSQVLFDGEAPVPSIDSDAARPLLAYGFIKKETRDADDGYAKKIYVISAPLLATVVLKSMTMNVPHTVDPPPAGAASDIKYAFHLTVHPCIPIRMMMTVAR